MATIPTLYGYSDERENVELNSVKEIVDFIVTDGLSGDTAIYSDDDYEPVCNTFGIYLDRCAPWLRALIIEPLIEAQMKAANEVFGGAM